MQRVALSLFVVFFVVSGVVSSVVALSAGPPASIEGDWILVEQSYGGGRANLPVSPDLDQRLSLEVRREGAGFAARVRAGRRDKSNRTWPAWVTADGPLPLEVLERTFDAVAAGFSARYHVWPSRNGDTTLEVVERYRLEGTDLVGTVHVTFERDGQRRGSYTLHRRFERAP
jgi:hypothetical protein